MESRTQTLEDKIKVVFNQLKTELKEKNSHEKVVAEQTERNNHLIKTWFQNMTFVKSKDVHDINIAGTTDEEGNQVYKTKNTKDPWTWDHISGEGVLKGFFYKHDPETPIMTYIDSIRMWGHTKSMFEVAKKMADKKRSRM